MAGLGRPGLLPDAPGSWLTTQLLEEVRGGSSVAWGWRFEGLGVSDVFLFFSWPCPVSSEDSAETKSIQLERTC